MDKENIDQQNISVPRPKFCLTCGQRLDGTGVHEHKGEGRGEKWAKRLKTWGGAVSGLFSILFYFLLISLFIGGGSLFGEGAVKSSEELYGSGEDKVAVIDVSGVLLEEDPGDSLGLAGGGATTSRGLLKTYEQLKEDENVKALVLRVNSPGGSVTAAEEIYQLTRRFKAETGMPVIVSLADTAASGGYYVSLAGDEIIADTITLTGSIGAIVQTVNIQELAERFGVKGVVITSGENKDLLNPFEEVEEEDIEILQSIVDEAREQFVERILESRSIDRARLETIADGRVLSGRQAKEVGLVDRLGNFNDAVELAKTKAGLTEATVVEFGKQGFLESLLGAFANRLTPTASFPFTYLQQFQSRPAYLYLP